jgi:hypothetical protein
MGKKATDIKLVNTGNLLELIPPVMEGELFNSQGKPVENFKSIINTEGQEIAVQKKTYQLVQHKDVVTELLNDLNFQSKYKIVDAVIYKSGCVMMLEIVPLIEQSVEIVPGDVIQPSVRIFNSYDSTKALTVESFGMRLICKNGAVAPGGVDRFHKTHTHQNININQIFPAIEKAIATWSVSAVTLRKAYTKIVDVEDTLKLLKNFPEKYLKIVKADLRRNDTLYNVWNALTSCITREMSVSTSTLVNYQRMVNKIFNVLNDPEEDVIINGSESLPETETTGTENKGTEDVKEDEKEDELE